MQNLSTQTQPVGCTVLAIDDDALVLALMHAVLGAAGFNVLTARSGAQGLELLRRAATGVQVVLLDYQMPVSNGAELLPAVRRLAPAAKVLGVSGTNLDQLAPAYRTGVDQLLSKPFTNAKLVAAVSALLPVNTAAVRPALGLFT
ncbi:MAG: response regulator [Verrucomicrobiota bacterium]|jgi:CheY-like chemotaxis protein